MKRYCFRLEPVLRVRRLQEDLAASQLRAANLAVTEAGELVAIRATRYAELPPAIGGALPDHLASRQRLEHAAAAVEHARTERRAAETAAGEARATWQEATTRVGALEHLDRERRIEHAREVEREEEREVDQLVMGRVRRRDDSGPAVP
jgi:flagellar export protein FliJ